MSPYPESHPVCVAREAKGLTREQLCKEAGCSKPALSYIERGYIPPQRRQLKIASILGVTVEHLWPGGG
jgi:transcriptional regulator with XRE-family HTH domain